MHPDSNEIANTDTFVFPARPQDAVLRLTITVEKIGGDDLKMSAVISPGGKTWSHDDVQRAFKKARVSPLAGIYVLETVDAFTVEATEAPEGVDSFDRYALALALKDKLLRYRLLLVKTIETLPGDEAVVHVARQITSRIISESLNRSLLEMVPVVDVSIVEIKGVACASWDLPPCTNDGIIKFKIDDSGTVPLVLVGYLGQGSVWAPFLNEVLAARVHEAIQVVAPEVAKQVLVRCVVAMRQYNRIRRSIQTTYPTGKRIIDALARAMEDEGRAELVNAPHTND